MIEEYTSEQYLPCVHESLEDLKEMAEAGEQKNLEKVNDIFGCSNDHGCCARSCGILW